MRTKHFITMLACVGASTLGAQTAKGGEPTDVEKRTAAEAIYAQASELLTAGNFNAACPKFEEVVKLQPNGIGARMTLADCYLGQRKFASAHTLYGQVASMASLANQPDRATAAREKAEALAPKLSKLTIVVPPDVASLPDLSIMRGGLVVTTSLFNVPVPVDGGDYTIVADAKGKKPFTRSIKVAEEGAKAQITLAFEAASSSDPKTPPGDATAEPLAAAETPSDTSAGMHPVRIGGIVVGSVGLVLAGVGLGVGVVRSADADEHRDRYNESNVEEENVAYVAASDQATLGWVLTGIGGAATVAGLIMIIAAPDGDAPVNGANAEANLKLDVGLGSFWLSGTF